MDLMMRVWPAAVKRVHEEVADMQPFAKADGVATVEPWDYRYYQEKVRKAKYNLSEDEIALSGAVEPDQGNVLVGRAALRPEVTENTGKVPVWQQDVRTFEVTNAKTGDLIGLFYLDTYGREGKRSGAWATGYRDPSGLLATGRSWSRTTITSPSRRAASRSLQASTTPRPISMNSAMRSTRC